MTSDEEDSGSAAIRVEPDQPLFSQSVEITVTGVEAGTEVTIRARMLLEDGIWESWAMFEADDDGRVDLTSQRPLRGTYQEVDSMGLFWSMSLETEKDVLEDEDDDVTSTVVHLIVERDGEEIATTEFERHFAVPGIETTDVRERGLVGKFYEPVGDGPHDAVILLGGSEGGIPNWQTASLLASHGYAVLATAYFGMDGLPNSLQGIRLEYFETAIDWLGAREDVQSAPIGVVGWSRGGELALLLGAHNSEIGTVVAFAPSHVVFQGLPEGWETADSAWKYEGSSLPFVPYSFSKRYILGIFKSWLLRRPLAFEPVYSRGLEEADEERIESATIPVEDIGGPVLLVSGEDDRMWPSSEMADAVIDRLDEYDYPHRYEHLTYEGAGHSISTPYRPTTDATTNGRFIRGLPFDLGGTPEATAAADADAWPRVLEFLDEGLRNEVESRPSEPPRN